VTSESVKKSAKEQISPETFKRARCQLFPTVLLLLLLLPLLRLLAARCLLLLFPTGFGIACACRISMFLGVANGN